jgi:hypothetical protein
MGVIFLITTPSGKGVLGGFKLIKLLVGVVFGEKEMDSKI